MAVEAGADAVGVNLWPGSKRFLPLAECAWLEAFARRVARVAVVVNASRQELDLIWQTGWFDCLQLHGDESRAEVESLGRDGVSVCKALRVRGVEVLTEAARYLEAGFPVLLDAYHPGVPGGTGQAWDWSLAARFARENAGARWILSGGLRVENVTDACAIVQAPAVDVASGVERPADPRHKDPALLRRFIVAAKEASRGSDTNPKIF
ncbi:MAG: phosphoribosylanthranilate isomerase [Verrucomicrobia bacterium]|nr:phosphoribosylanthranilate isomerase [Verrucomicrobiota bacterium]